VKRRTCYLVAAACTLAGISSILWLSRPLLREEVFFSGIEMPLHESIRMMYEVSGDHRDPFAANHPLSQVKPDLTERPLPVSVPTRTRTVMIEQSQFSFPAIGDVKTFERGPLAAMVRSPGCTVAVSQANVHDLVFSLPAESRAKYAKMRFFSRVDEALRQLQELPEFDRLIRILCADAHGFGRSRPLSERVANLLLLSYKSMFIPPDPNIPVRYYRSADVRCLLVGPEPYCSEVLQLSDVDEQSPEQLQTLASPGETRPVVEQGQAFRAWLSSRDGETLVELTFRYRQPSDLAQIAEGTLTFLGQCRIDD
jgi:hypothetical protein